MPIPVIERSESEIASRIRRRVRSMTAVADCDEVSMGFTRKKPNIHFHVVLRQNPSLEETHLVCARIDREVRLLVPNARVVIHSQSSGMGDMRDVRRIVKKIAEGEPGSRGVKNMHLRRANGDVGMDFQLVIAGQAKTNAAGDLAAQVMQKLKAADAGIPEVVIHQESVSLLVSNEWAGHGSELKSYIEHVAGRFPELMLLGPPTRRMAEDGLHFVDRVAFKPGTSNERMDEIISQLSSQLSAAVRNANPDFVKAEIIGEPANLSEA